MEIDIYQLLRYLRCSFNFEYSLYNSTFLPRCCPSFTQESILHIKGKDKKKKKSAMHYSIIYPALGLLLSLTCNVNLASASPIGEYPYADFPGMTPNLPFTEGAGFKLCKKEPIRYNPKHFVCHDNAVICPILDQGSDNPRPMQRCGDSCFDERYGRYVLYIHTQLIYLYIHEMN